MPVKVDYKRCCWKGGKCTSGGCGCGSACAACIGCVEACPVGALSRKDRVVVDIKKCIGCGACASACKHNAISLNR